MIRLQILSQLVQDAYYQQYAKDSDFFKDEHFDLYCATFFYQVLQEDFEKTRNQMISLGLIMGDDEPVINASWYTLKRFKVEKKDGQYSVTIPSMFSFNKDIQFTGIKGVYPIDDTGDCCGSFAKIKADQCYTLKYLPKSDKTIYWYPLTNKIFFKKVQCGLDEVDIAYIPSLDSECEPDEVVVPESYVAEIMTRTYNFMATTRKADVVDKTNNQNPNKIIQTEIAQP